jgi:hypothetical protein
MKIWSYSKQTGQTELIDTVDKKEAAFIVREYQAAFGLTFVVWSGLKRDNPITRPSSGQFDETSHYKCDL